MKVPARRSMPRPSPSLRQVTLPRCRPSPLWLGCTPTTRWPAFTCGGCSMAPKAYACSSTSGPILTFASRFGWHILQMLESKDHHGLVLDKAGIGQDPPGEFDDFGNGPADRRFRKGRIHFDLRQRRTEVQCDQGLVAQV